MSRMPDWLPVADELPHLWVMVWGFGILALLWTAVVVYGLVMSLWSFLP